MENIKMLCAQLVEDIGAYAEKFWEGHFSLSRIEFNTLDHTFKTYIEGIIPNNSMLAWYICREAWIILKSHAKDFKGTPLDYLYSSKDLLVQKITVDKFLKELNRGVEGHWFKIIRKQLEVLLNEVILDLVRIIDECIKLKLSKC